ncbi:MAG: hypothetical protein NZ989_02350 [Bacteroidia bacterium]|nr:hypothetical protein [Bacteroidia bacterium]MDW8056958.1 hypothetical protein [Bacteroidia bacterium]
METQFVPDEGSYRIVVGSHGGIDLLPAPVEFGSYRIVVGSHDCSQARLIELLAYLHSHAGEKGGSQLCHSSG